MYTGMMFHVKENEAWTYLKSVLGLCILLGQIILLLCHFLNETLHNKDTSIVNVASQGLDHLKYA